MRRRAGQTVADGVGAGPGLVLRRARSGAESGGVAGCQATGGGDGHGGVRSSEAIPLLSRSDAAIGHATCRNPVRTFVCTLKAGRPARPRPSQERS
jgi:hypothetical protein